MKQVLIVDDSAIIRASIRKVLLLVGVAEEGIHQAENGAEALEKIHARSFDLVLLDLNMPVMNGEEFAEQVRKLDPDSQPTIVVVSTESNRERLNRMAELGVAGFLSKPFQPEDLGRYLLDQVRTSA